MATQVTLNSGSVDSAGSLALKTNGTTTAVTINSSQGVEFNAGTAALPSITTTGDTNTGIFFPAADTIAFSEGGAEAMRINSSGNVGIGTAGAPLSRLDVAVEASLSRRLLVNFDDSVITVKGASNTAAPEALRIIGDNIRFNTGTSGSGTEAARIDSSGNFLVGTTTVAGSAKLTVNGDIATSGTGTGSRLRNQIDGVSVSTSATTIIVGGDIGQLVVINGISGSDRFCDLVMSSTGAAPVVVQSFTALGSPVARTYTRSGSNLQLAMASGTYTVRALSLGA